MTRDPYDRLTSAYIDKVVMVQAPPTNASDFLGGNGCGAAKQLIKKKHPLTKYPTFADFLEVLSEMELGTMDPHTFPFSYRCGTDKFKYDMVGRLTHFDSDMQTLFNAMNLGKYEAYHKKDLGADRNYDAMHTRIELLNKFKLRPDTLEMHGNERVHSFYDPHLRKLVSEGWWKEDVKQFGEF